MNKRIFVEKNPGFDVEAKQLTLDLKANLDLSVTGLRHFVVYDIFSISEATFEQALLQVFTEPLVNYHTESVDLDQVQAIAFEPLPGQYDQRSDSAMQCLKLIDFSNDSTVKSGILIVFDPIEPDDYKRIESYLINPIENRLKDLHVLQRDEQAQRRALTRFDGFIASDDRELEALYHRIGFAMALEDLIYIRDYFRKEQRDPSETELKVLDTYWSDHCRHTTFNTVLDTIEFTASPYRQAIEASLQEYLADKQQLGRSHKPLSLMDIAAQTSRYAQKILGDRTIERSDEINACSIVIDVDVDGIMEPWLLMFKNETHNHPTEIEPFGGASTCIGGAIRDPLSGRAYVYQAMRISGSAPVTRPLSMTRPHKLPQQIIGKKSAHGYSSYGNQIGLTTSFVRELYHDSYEAKHMELGAVVGAVKQSSVVRELPVPGDVIILLGGRTGRDGIGGATGSSIAHHQQSLTHSATEVQKGNAIEERKIQRLFRNPDVTRLIKKSNDFGAGGVSVAIGELADGIDIDLDQVRVKYQGLNATELAISESQERMAVVVSADDAERFIRYAHDENCEAYPVATVTSNHRLRMFFNGVKVVDIDRTFLNSAGVVAHRDVLITAPQAENPLHSFAKISCAYLHELLSDITVASQKGLIEMFDSSIGATTVLPPLSGKYLLNENIASVQKIPVLAGATHTCSVLSYGFIPKLSEYSPYLGAIYAIVESVAKTVAVGGDYRTIYLSLQEYFNKLSTPAKWGNVLQAMLGAYHAQKQLGLWAIGGKDSMSGSYEELDVVDTLVSFACSPQDVRTIISSELKQPGNYLYAVDVRTDDHHMIDFDYLKNGFEAVSLNIANGTIISASTGNDGSIIQALLKMAMGNKCCFTVDADDEYLTRINPGVIVVEATQPLEAACFRQLGSVIGGEAISINRTNYDIHSLMAAYTQTLEPIYPTFSFSEPKKPLFQPFGQRLQKRAAHQDEVRVLIPVFPGTNCEYDTARAFAKHGAHTEVLVFNNRSAQDIHNSIYRLEKAIRTADIIALAGGFSGGDEPDGSAKFIVSVLKNSLIKDAITDHLKKHKLILGICNGFQALVKSGLLPYGEIRDHGIEMTLAKNDINRHISTLCKTVVSSVSSPWLSSFELGDIYEIPISHGEGKLVGSDPLLEQCFEAGQVAFQYCDDQGQPLTHAPNGSMHSIEALTSHCGLILGKMAHNERIDDYTMVGRDIMVQDIFKNGVDYFRK